MIFPQAPRRVSVHGGHSGEFCCHAKDRLEDILTAYRKMNFAWVGVTEHMPPVDDRFLYPDEIAAGLNARRMVDRFIRYLETARRLQRSMAPDLTVFVGFETEAYSGALAYARDLMETFSPDYVVGSVHHVHDLPIDNTPALYRQAAEVSGGMEALYLDYFDLQLEMIETLKPRVVGHFDLIRIFDPDYPERVKKSEIRTRVRRNLEAVRDHGSILDFNARALAKGMAEPYVAAPILETARSMEIAIVPGDDSHGIDSVGLHVDDAMEILSRMGFDTQWPCPAR